MFNHNLTKREKKIARELIEKGLIAEFESGLSGFDKVLNKWKTKQLGTKNAYYELYDSVKNFDKHIGRRYDGMSGSNYLITVINLVSDGIIDVNDTNQFESKTREIISRFLKD